MAYEYLRSQGVIRTQKDLAVLMGSDKTNISQALNHGKGLTESYLYRLNKAVNDLFSYEWLFNGTGEMLANTGSGITVPHSNVVNGNNNSNISQTINHQHEASCQCEGLDVETGAVEGTPVKFVPYVPTKITQDPDIEVYDYIQREKTARQPAVEQFVRYDMTYSVRSMAMSPRIQSGDLAALRYMGEHPRVIDGEVYTLDVKGAGMIIREAYNTAEGYRLRSRNHERFPDINVEFAVVMGVYEVVGIVIKSNL